MITEAQVRTAATAFRLDIVPMGAPRQSQRDKWDPSPAVERYRAYCDELRIKAALAGYELDDRVDVVFHIPMPRSWSGRKRRTMAGTPHQQKPDTDNLLKGFCDALLGDDCHVWDMRGRKLWAAEGAIEIETTLGIGA